jgi:EmrB/QacA subfamily drug resistance transporter
VSAETEGPDGRAAIFVATIASFVSPFMGAAVNVALPAIGAEFSLPAVALGWVATSYILAAAIFLLPFGRLGDLYGRKRVFLAGNVLFTIASLLCALARSAAMLVGSRLLQGVGAAMIFGTSVAIVTSAVPTKERGKALGIAVAATYLGLSLGPVIGGFLTHQFGWRSIFFFTAPFGALVIAFVVFRLEGEWTGAKGERFDAPGAALSSVSLAALMFGFTRLPAAAGAWLILAGAAGIAAFGFWELRARDPLIDLRLAAGNRIFAFSNLAALVNYSASFAVGFLISLYLQYIRGFDPRQAGAVLVAQPIVMALCSPGAGRLSDRIESRIVASIGMAITAASLFLFIFLGAGTPLAAIVLNLMLLGFGFALFSSPNTNAVMSSVERRFYGVAGATLGTMRAIGQMMSLGIAMLIFSLVLGGARITPEHHGRFLESVRTAFVVFSALSVAAVFASLARGAARARTE